MESKTKHRVLGILVIAGLIVILLPFFQRGKDISSETAMIQPPTFPDQSMQRGLNVNEAMSENEKSAVPATAAQANENDAKPLPIIQKTADEIVKEQPDEAINTSEFIAPILEDATTPDSTGQKVETAENNVLQNPVTNESIQPQSDVRPETLEPTTVSNPTPTQIGQTATTTDSKEQAAEAPKKELTQTKKADSQKRIIKVKSNHASNVHTKKKLLTNAKRKLSHRKTYLHLPIDDNGLANINNSVWVIQVGSFKNKANALRVVNRLRANGYRAFIQQVSTSLGKNTRVFVGPENKQSSANALVHDLKSNMDLQGIVISYKPLAS